MLPDEMLANIFQYLKISQVRNAAFVCKRWEEVAKLPTVWINRCLLYNSTYLGNDEVQLESFIKYVKMMSISI